MSTQTEAMSTQYYGAKVELKDAKGENQRRFRNIIANSGEIMESGEIRELDQLYVMGYDSNLYKISDLATDPEKQTEKYAVKAQADHGQVIDGELVPSIEKQFGSCRVWLEDDGLHARMYFADNDNLADHAWAISEDASYSTGIDWFPDGYYGTGYEIDQPIGILREISMVLTGNDPRAKTLDAKKDNADGVDMAAESDDSVKNNITKGNEMSKDALTPDESRAMAEELVNVVERFTTSAPESETEPTRRDTKDDVEAEGEAEAAEAPAEKTADNVKHMPVVIIKDKVAKQEKVAAKYDWLHGAEGHKAFADTLKSVGRMGASFDNAWRAVASQHMSLDGITGLPNPAPVEQYFADALENSDGIISHFQFISAKSFRLNMLSVAAEGNGRAAGHKKGDTKVNQDLADTTRDLLVKMVYKRLDLDATELYENPWLIDFRSRELVNAIIVEIERAAIIGDGRSSGTPDLRMFDGTRGFYSVAADAAAVSGFGTFVADSVSVAGGNLYDGVVAGRGKIKTEGGQYIVAKASAVTAMLSEKTANGYLVTPGSRIEDILGVERVYTPAWMENASADAYLIVNNAYKHGGEGQIRVRAEFDTATNTDILLDETPRFGSLGDYKSAVAITLTSESE